MTELQTGGKAPESPCARLARVRPDIAALIDDVESAHYTWGARKRTKYPTTEVDDAHHSSATLAAAILALVDEREALRGNVSRALRRISSGAPVMMTLVALEDALMWDEEDATIIHRTYVHNLLDMVGAPPHSDYAVRIASLRPAAAQPGTGEASDATR